MDEVGRIREKTDIVALISEFISLKKMGRNFKTTCPFHNEKTPSFVVSPERQIWHCFGCGKGGDAFTFLMEYENLEFVEALRILAKKAGIELSQSDFVKQGASRKESIYKINQKSAEFYHYVLIRHPSGKKALEYLLNNRKIDQRLIETFKIGYAPQDGTALSKYFLEKKKQKTQDLLDAGISVLRSGRVFDFFRGRIMFPISDHRDNIVAFSGRVLDDRIKESKYVNTRDTLAYHKGSTFFGLNMAKETIKKENKAILVEGEFDVISCYSEGIKNTIAIKGTALTSDQVALLSRFTDRISLCLDQDEAGFEAIKRSLSAIEQKGLTTSVVELGDYKDPDEAIKKDPLSFKKQLREETPVYDYLISKALDRFDTKTALGKKKIAENILPFLSQIDNEIIKEHYLKRLSSELDSSIENLKTELEKATKKEKLGIQIAPSTQEKRSRREILEEYLMALLIQLEDRKKAVREVSEILSDYIFEIPAYQKIFGSLKTFSLSDKQIATEDFVKTLPREIISVFDRCYLLPLAKFEDKDKYLDEILKISEESRVLFVKNKIKQLSQMFNKGDRKEGKMEELQKELSVLVSSINQHNLASKN